MRTLLTFCTLATALLVPWNSVVDSWVSHQSTADSETENPFRGAVALIDAQTGILPLTSEADSPADEATEPSDSPTADRRKRLNLAELFSTKESPSATVSPPGLICENGVCRIDDARPTQHATQDATTVEMTWEHARRSLDELGVTQFRLERLGDGEGYRFSCALPVSEGSRAMRRFEATADDDLAAVAQVLNDVASWHDSQTVAAESERGPRPEPIGLGRTARPLDESGL
jgi:hypothetical protein